MMSPTGSTIVRSLFFVVFVAIATHILDVGTNMKMKQNKSKINQIY